MAILVIDDGKVFMNGYNLSASFNEVAVNGSAEMKDVTTFGNGGTRIFKPGLLDVSVTGKGLSDFDDTAAPPVDKAIFDQIGAVAAVMSFAREGNAEGDISFMLQGVQVTCSPVQGSVGDMFEFTYEARGGGARLVRGVVMAVGTKAASGATATAIQLGAVAAGQKVYGALHAYGTVAGTLDMIVQSDDAVGMASPTTRLTFTQMSAIGAEWKEAAGAITDTWWRASWTISGGGSFPLFLTVGIL